MNFTHIKKCFNNSFSLWKMENMAYKFPGANLMLMSLLVLLGLGVGGCSLPGISFNGGSGQQHGENGAHSGYQVQSITPQLLEKQAQARAQTAIGEPNPPLQEALSNYSYQVAPQDVIAVTVWGHPEFSPDRTAMTELDSAGNIGKGAPASNASAPVAGFTVHTDGSIYFPYVGKIHVAGQTTSEIRAKITQMLSAYVVKPQVSVVVVGFHSQTYQLAGAVLHPGLYPITNVPMTVSQAIQAAGGILQTVPTVTVASKASATALADLAHVLYIHDGKRAVLNLRDFFEYGDKSQDRLLHPGDIVQVPDNSFDQVHLIGEVNQPGNYPLDNGQLNLAQALGAAGGLNLDTSNPSRIFVFRGAYQKPQIFWLNARSPESMLLATQFQLKPQDVVFVATAGISTWNRIITQILPTVQTLYETKVLTRQ